MALTESDIQEFIETLQHNAELRERVRAVILADDFMALPGLVRANTEAIAALTERMMAAEARLERLERRVDHLAGQVGNLSGEVYELKYPRRVASRLARLFREVRVLEDTEFAQRLQDLVPPLSPPEWDDVLLLDAIVEATSRENGERVVLALEIPRTVAREDVVGADRRAKLVAQLGFKNVRACVDGDAIEREAKALAERMNVLALVQREAQPAA